MSTLPNDALGHEALASMVAAYIESMPQGSVIAIQGSWGSGKTDVLERVAGLLSAERGHPRPLWVNPWKYGNPDLITPVVLHLAARVAELAQPDSEKSKVFWELAETVVRAGAAMAFKAVTIVAPFGEVFGAGQGAVDDYVKNLFDKTAGEAAGGPDFDPVAVVAKRFAALIDQYTALTSQKGRVVICVDDLDRCLPDRQVAMLEAIHFLTSTAAACSFIVAIDPTLVRQAAETHYRTAGFDSHRYLDKLFQLRLNLPSLRAEDVRPLFAQLVMQNATEETVEAAFGAGREALANALAGVFVWPELTNPRLIERTVRRLQLLATALEGASDAELRDHVGLNPLCVWTAISERWPQLREVLQASDPDNWGGNVRLVAHHYGIAGAADTDERRKQLDAALHTAANVLARLPNEAQSPDLGAFLFQAILQSSDVAAMIEQLYGCDRVCRRYAL